MYYNILVAFDQREILNQVAAFHASVTKVDVETIRSISEEESENEGEEYEILGRMLRTLI